jgi:hypothetical protein
LERKKKKKKNHEKKKKKKKEKRWNVKRTVLILIAIFRWTLWFDNPPKKASKENWGEALKPLSTFDTVEDFWAYVGHRAMYYQSQFSFVVIQCFQ